MSYAKIYFPHKILPTRWPATGRRPISNRTARWAGCGSTLLKIQYLIYFLTCTSIAVAYRKLAGALLNAGDTPDRQKRQRAQFSKY